jgi:hypothetical protein
LSEVRAAGSSREKHTESTGGDDVIGEILRPQKALARADMSAHWEAEGSSKREVEFAPSQGRCERRAPLGASMRHRSESKPRTGKMPGLECPRV